MTEEKHLATESDDADRPWTVEDGAEVSEDKKSWLSPRHLYMIALGGRQHQLQSI